MHYTKLAAAVCTVLAALSASSPSALGDGLSAPAATMTPLRMPDLGEPGALMLELGYAHTTTTVLFGSSELSIITGALSGQVEVLPGLLAYGRLPFAHAASNDISEADMGNLSLGVRYVRRAGPLRFGGSLVIAFPTSPDPEPPDGGRSSDGFGAITAVMARFDQSMDYAAQTTSYRLSSDIAYASGILVAQGQLAYEQAQRDDGSEPRDMLRIGAAAGVRVLPRLTLLAELTTLGVLIEENPMLPSHLERWFHWLDAGVRYDAGRATVTARLYKPLDEPSNGEMETIGMGVDASFRF